MEVELTTKREDTLTEGRKLFRKKTQQKVEEDKRRVEVGQGIHVETPLGVLVISQVEDEFLKLKYLRLESRFGDRKDIMRENEASSVVMKKDDPYFLAFPLFTQVKYSIEKPKTEVEVKLVNGPEEESSVGARLIPPQPHLEASVALEIPRS